jgi:hypothetical protein
MRLAALFKSTILEEPLHSQHIFNLAFNNPQKFLTTQGKKKKGVKKGPP